MFSQSEANNFEYGIAYKGKLLALFEVEGDRDCSLGRLREKFIIEANKFIKIEPEDFE